MNRCNLVIDDIQRRILLTIFGVALFQLRQTSIYYCFSALRCVFSFHVNIFCTFFFKFSIVNVALLFKAKVKVAL